MTNSGRCCLENDSDPNWNKKLLRLFNDWKMLIKQRALYPAGSVDRQRIDVIYKEVFPLIVALTEEKYQINRIGLVAQAQTILENWSENMRTGKEIGRTISDLESQVKRLENDIKTLELQTQAPDLSAPGSIEALETANNSLISKRAILVKVRQQITVNQRELREVIKAENNKRLDGIKQTEHERILEVIKALTGVQLAFDELEKTRQQIGTMGGHSDMLPHLDPLSKAITSALKNTRGFRPELWGEESKWDKRERENKKRQAELEKKRQKEGEDYRARPKI